MQDQAITKTWPASCSFTPTYTKAFYVTEPKTTWAHVTSQLAVLDADPEYKKEFFDPLFNNLYHYFFVGG